MHGKTDATSRQNSPIFAALDDAGGAIGALEENVVSLSSRLAPVLRDIDGDTGEDGDECSSNCALEEEIHRLTRRIRTINNLIISLYRRIAI